MNKEKIKPMGSKELSSSRAEYANELEVKLRDIDKILKLVRPIAEELSGGNVKEKALASAFRIVELELIGKLKGSWPVSSEYKENDRDLTYNEWSEALKKRRLTYKIC